jgi:hypothetical protein
MNTSETLEPLDEKISSENIPVILAEYNSLKAEVLKRIEIRHQLTSLALIAPGTIIAVGFQVHNPFLILSYPILACLLSAVWLANIRAYHEVSIYIRTQVEPKLGRTNLRWQYVHYNSPHPFRLVGFLGSGAIFIFTELLAILAGIALAKFDVLEIILLALAILSVLLTILMVIQPASERRKLNRKKDAR